ncbi:MAG: hypothetical protein A2169_07085 [Deltaproteobacteria bacterium RBG_13_47_9]|nr:MAG: hypothetical protein A2169_07085 [Deltaproteobacteria bacterium RBG_13_47_9]
MRKEIGRVGWRKAKGHLASGVCFYQTILWSEELMKTVFWPCVRRRVAVKAEERKEKRNGLESSTL